MKSSSASPSNLPALLRQAQHVLFVEITSIRCRAAVLKTDKKGWRCEGQIDFAGVEAASSELGNLLKRLLQGRRPPRVAVLLSTQIATVTLPVSIPAGISAAEAEESLRWEADSVWQSGRNGGVDAETLLLAWQRAAGADQTHLTLAPDGLVGDWREAFSRRGITLLGMLSSAAVAWHGLKGTASPLRVLFQVDGRSVHALIGHPPELELALRCAATPADIARQLAREVRALPSAALLALPGPEVEPLRLSLADAGVKSAVSILETPWAEQLCTFAGSESQTLPWVDLRPPPTPILKRPQLWWAAAAAALLLIVLPNMLGWRTELAQSTSSLQSRQKDSLALEQRLAALRAEEAEFSVLQQQLRQIESEIQSSRLSGLSPSQSSRAQPNYVRSLLDSLAQGFARRGRVTDFSADYAGKVVMKGQAASDSQAQAALGVFHQAMEKMADFKPIALTTRRATPKAGDGGVDGWLSPGLDFTAQTGGGSEELFHITTSEPTSE